MSLKAVAQEVKGKLAQTLSAFNSQKDALLKEIDNLQRQISDFANAVNTMKDDVEGAEKMLPELQSLAQSVAALRSEVEKLSSSKLSLQQQLQALQQMRASLEQKRQQLQQALAQIQALLSGATTTTTTGGTGGAGGTTKAQLSMTAA